MPSLFSSFSLFPPRLSLSLSLSLCLSLITNNSLLGASISWAVFSWGREKAGCEDEFERAEERERTGLERSEASNKKTATPHQPRRLRGPARPPGLRQWRSAFLGTACVCGRAKETRESRKNDKERVSERENDETVPSISKSNFLHSSFKPLPARFDPSPARPRSGSQA